MVLGLPVAASTISTHAYSWHPVGRGARRWIEAERVGLELVLPLAAILPFERHVQWTQTRQIPQKVVENLLNGAGALAGALIGRKSTLPGPIGLLAKLVTPDLVTEAAKLAGDKLKEMNAEALAKQQYLTATLTGFRIDLDKGEEEQILPRSRR